MNSENSAPQNRSVLPVALGALGVVFGDIGTSPLYAVNQIFHGSRPLPITDENIIGTISLVIWTLTSIISVKYLLFVLRADNDGEGGVFALYSLLHKHKRLGLGVFLSCLLFAAGLLFGGGIITPAISVLSAVEGLKVLSPSFERFIIPLTILILTGLFTIQSKGTALVGSFFGPIILVWFLFLAVVGGYHLQQFPHILEALNPLRGLGFLLNSNLLVIAIVLGGVMLSVTGGEAMYADMGHFGRPAIKLSWFAVVYPALILNYLGQGAYLLARKPIVDGNLFYSMVPHGMAPMVVVLATIATTIASQALISGAFSLTSQAVALGVFPRLRIVHTHHHHAGQIYVPFVNWALWLGCILLVLNFRSSTNLASAYGLAVAGDMTATSIAMILVSRFCWRWHWFNSISLFGAFVVIDLIFLVATGAKFFDGAYVPLVVGAGIFIIMLTWKWGRKATFNAYSGIKAMTIQELCELKDSQSSLIDRNMIFMVPRHLSSLDQEAPAILQMFWNSFQKLPRNIIFVEVVHVKMPHIHHDRYGIRIFQKDDGKGAIIGVTIRFGFMEDPNVETVLAGLATHHQVALPSDPREWLVQASIENIFPSTTLYLFRRLRFRLFALLRQISLPGHYYYGLGDQVQLSLKIVPVRID